MDKRDERDYYDALGVQGDSTQEQIDRRYRVLAGAFAQVEKAYEVLGNPSRRRAYDARRRALGDSSARASLRSSRARQEGSGLEAPRVNSWRMSGPAMGVVGGLLLGAAVLLLLAASTGNWSKVGGLFSTEPDAPTVQGGTLDRERVARLEMLVQQDPANTGALFELGEAFFDAGEWSLVLSWFGRLLELEPGNTHVLNDVALANFYLGRYDQAQDTWEKALGVDPEDPFVHYSLGFFYGSSPLYDNDLATDHFQEVVRLAAGSDLAQSAQGQLAAMGAPAEGEESP